MLPVRNDVREKRRQKLKNRAYPWPASLDQIVSVEREHQLIAPENTRFGPLPRVVVSPHLSAIGQSTEVLKKW